MRFATSAALSVLLTSWLTAKASELTVSWWEMEASGSGSVGINDLAGTTFNLGGDLGLSEAENIMVFDARIGETVQIGLQYLELELEGDNTINSTIRFRDLVFNPRTRVQSELNLQMAQAYLRLSPGTPAFRGGLEAGVVYADVELNASASRIGSATTDAQALIPFGGIHLTIAPLPFIEFGGFARYSSFDVQDVISDYREYQAFAHLKAGPLMGGAAYRKVEVKGDYSSDRVRANIEFEGPMLYLGLSF